MANVIGLLLEQDIKQLRYLASQVNDGIIVEIGTFRGLSATVMAREMNGNSYLITMDNYESRNKNEKSDLNDMINNLKNVGVKEKIIAVVSKSETFSKFWNQQIDLLFIDGAHDYKSVSQDFNLWSKFIKNNGKVAFHDYNNTHPDVKTFCDEVRDNKSFEFESVAGSVITFRRVE